MGSIRKSWGLCLPISVILHPPPLSFCCRKASTRRKRAGPWSAGPCSFRSGRRSRPARSRRRRQTKSAMKQPCAGQRASTSSLSVPTLTKATFTITFITTPPPWTVPGNSITSSAPALRCGGSLTGCALSTSCLLSKIRSSTARAAFSIMDNGSGKSPPSAQQRVRLGDRGGPGAKARRLPGVSAAHGGVRLCR